MRSRNLTRQISFPVVLYRGTFVETHLAGQVQVLREWAQVVISVVTVGTSVILLIDDRNEQNGLNQKQPGWWAVLTTGCSNQEDVVGQEYAGPSMHEITMHAREQTYFLTQRRPTLITNHLNYFYLCFFATLFSVY